MEKFKKDDGVVQFTTFYPKTQRYENTSVIITEKLDGTNMSLIKFEEELYIAMRNTMISLTTIKGIEATPDKFRAKGVFGWLKDNGDFIKDNMLDDMFISLEWFRASRKDIANRFKTPRYYAIGFVEEDVEKEGGLYPYFKPTTIKYDYKIIEETLINHQDKFDNLETLFQFVPIVKEYDHYPTRIELDSLYDEYSKMIDYDKVEGFVINHNNQVVKYIRLKNGKPSPHFTTKEIIEKKKQTKTSR